MTREADIVEEPAPAVVQRMTQRGTGEPEGRMITVAGDVLDRTATQVSWDGSEWHFTPQPLAWRRIATLSPAALDELRDAVRRSGALDAPAAIEPPGVSIGGTNVTWTLTDGARCHVVELHGVPDAKHPAISALEQAVDAVVAAAIQAQAGGPAAGA